MERVYLHIASGGAEGRTPFLAADVTTALRERGADAHLIGLMPQPPWRMHFVVDGVEVYVDGHMAGDGMSCAVRFDAVRAVPAYEPDVSRILRGAWPKTLDEVSHILGREVSPASYTMRCVSEGIVADAVLAYVSVAKKMWSQEEEEESE